MISLKPWTNANFQMRLCKRAQIWSKYTRTALILINNNHWMNRMIFSKYHLFHTFLYPLCLFIFQIDVSNVQFLLFRGCECVCVRAFFCCSVWLCDLYKFGILLDMLKWCALPSTWNMIMKRQMYTIWTFLHVVSFFFNSHSLIIRLVRLYHILRTLAHMCLRQPFDFWKKKMIYQNCLCTIWIKSHYQPARMWIKIRRRVHLHEKHTHTPTNTHAHTHIRMLGKVQSLSLRKQISKLVQNTICRCVCMCVFDDFKSHWVRVSGFFYCYWAMHISNDTNTSAVELWLWWEPQDLCHCIVSKHKHTLTNQLSLCYHYALMFTRMIQLQ